MAAAAPTLRGLLVRPAHSVRCPLAVVPSCLRFTPRSTAPILSRVSCSGRVHPLLPVCPLNVYLTQTNTNGRRHVLDIMLLSFSFI